MNLNTETWKEFELKKLFKIKRLIKVSSKDGGYVKDHEIISDDGTYPYVAAVSVLNGIKGYTNIKPNNKGNCITFSTTTDSATTAFYQPVDFVGRQQMVGLYGTKDNQMNLRRAMFLIPIIKKSLAHFNYSNKLTYSYVDSLKILLPAKLYNDSPKYHPDWEFMEEYIKYIENKYIEKVDEFNRDEIDKALKVTGLSEKDLDGDLSVEPAGMYCEFKVSDLFESVKTRGVNNDSLNKDFDSGAYRYITRTSFNNGISGLTGKIDNLNPQPANSFSLGLLNMDFFFQSKKWYSGQFVRGIIPKFKINNILALYFKTLLDKRSDNYKKGLVRDFDETFLNDRLTLPAIDEKTPDFEYMEKAIYIYIRETIKSWKLDNEKEINALKTIINS